MPLHHNDKFLDLEIQSKLIADQIRAERANNDICDFFESERKKYKKTNEIEDLLNSHKFRF